MDPKRWLIICSIALMLTLSSGLRGEPAAAAAANKDLSGQVSPTDYASATDRSDEQAGVDSFLQLLGAASEEDVHDALYNGLSLVDIAEENGQDPQTLIDAQIRELKEQLRSRLISGSITWEQYQAYIAEIPDLIGDSALGRMQA